MDPFLAGVIQNALGGLVAGSTAFLAARQVMELPDLAGEWTIHSVCTSSAFNPYRGLQVTSIALIWCSKGEIRGSIEKVYESRADGTSHEFVGRNRSRSEFSGGMSGLSFVRKSLALHSTDTGLERESSTLYRLTREWEGRLKGTFFSTAANSKGTSTWTRGISHYNFEFAP
jgi:hypothetical protein